MKCRFTFSSPTWGKCCAQRGGGGFREHRALVVLSRARAFAEELNDTFFGAFGGRSGTILKIDR